MYERVPHITLKSIANNAEIDVIWERWQETLEPLRAELNEALGRAWEEWEIPREPGDRGLRRPYSGVEAAAGGADRRREDGTALLALNGALRGNYTSARFPTSRATRGTPARPTCIAAGGRRASPVRRRSTPPSPRRRTSSTCTTSHTRIGESSASPVRSRSRAWRRTARSVLGENDELIDHLAESKTATA